MKAGTHMDAPTDWKPTGFTVAGVCAKFNESVSRNGALDSLQRIRKIYDIRPLRVGPLANHERVPKSWGFFVATRRRKGAGR